MIDQDVTILEREEAVHVSTFASEIVTCQLGDGTRRRLLLKRGGTHSVPTYGHRGGVPYEAEIYRSVLASLPASTPSYYAAESDPATGETSLFIDYIDGASRLEFSDPEFIVHAARWIAAFHRLNELRAEDLAHVVHRYDLSYYMGWANRTQQHANGQNFAWLPDVVRAFEALAEELVQPPLTVIHGEYYPKNILVKDGNIIPVDWESTALAAGEIDLVSLSEGWPAQDKKDCEAEYRHERWPTGAPAAFERRLAIAEVYLLFRWLGDRPEWAIGEEASLQFETLRQLGERLGVL